MKVRRSRLSIRELNLVTELVPDIRGRRLPSCCKIVNLEPSILINSVKNVRTSISVSDPRGRCQTRSRRPAKVYTADSTDRQNVSARAKSRRVPPAAAPTSELPTSPLPLPSS